LADKAKLECVADAAEAVQRLGNSLAYSPGSVE